MTSLSTLRLTTLAAAIALLTVACEQAVDHANRAADHAEAHAEQVVDHVTDTLTPAKQTGAPTPAEASEFVQAAEAKLAEMVIDLAQTSWIQANFITADSQAIAARSNEAFTAATVELANQAARYNGLELDYDTNRKLNMLKLALTLPAPQDGELIAELAKITSELEATYGKGEYCRSEDECWSLPNMTRMLASERDPELLKEIWVGWRAVSPPMREQYVRMVDIANQGAKQLGYPDLGTMWRSKYDMEADAFATEMDRLWGQVEPLYDSLHCHVRAKLGEFYGEDVVPQDKPIPAHLLGNMWAQSWSNVYPLVAPQDADPGFDLTEQIEKSGMTELDMVKQAETFFTSLGFEPLPETFWERSLFLKPADRDVVCHASAWNIDNVDDLRIKMCIQKTAEDFVTIHHELGHNFYQRAYNQQPFSYQGSANDGFHEAIGDTVALSITPDYLKEIGLIDDVPDASKDLGLLMAQAMDKIAFLPFSLVVDQWRWKVFNGEIAPTNYNQGWWDLRTKYQGIEPPVARSENDFDPGAKYHIPGNTPYSRYFLAHILQFQFHRALCEIVGYDGPLHRCSIYGNEAAGTRLNEMLEMGTERPWPEALNKLTGSEEMDATAILDYFAPLKIWLDEQNKDRQCGW